MSAPDWSPFRAGKAARRARGLNGPDGLGDRLRTAAFAERQAAAAFLWAADSLADADGPLREAWRRFAREEEKHYGWIMERMQALRIDPAAREVSDALWRSLTSSPTAAAFCETMARAEDRGRQAERAFQTLLAGRDSETAAVFGRIAAEEDEHIARQLAG